jgi:hypothetical protein
LVGRKYLQYLLARQLRRCNVAITFAQPRHDPTAPLDHLQAPPETAAAPGRAGRARLAPEGRAAGRVDATGREQGIAGNRDDLRHPAVRSHQPGLEGEFRDCGIRFPQHLLETTSAFATLALLQANPSFVAVVSIEVAQFFARQQMSCILPVALASRSEPYELVTRKWAPVQPVAKLLIDELVHRRS